MLAHDYASAWAGTVGLLIFVLLFAAAVAYAVWPGNRRMFERLSHLPLHDDEGGNDDERGPRP